MNCGKYSDERTDVIYLLAEILNDRDYVKGLVKGVWQKWFTLQNKVNALQCKMQQHYISWSS